MRILALAVVFIFTQATPAFCWWQYAEWGLSSRQITSASGGRAIPCQPQVPACARPPGGVAPSLFVDGITMIGMPALAAFAFDAGDHLIQTVVFFPGATPDLIEKLLQGVHGIPVDAQASPPVWRDARRGSDITPLSVKDGVMLLYRPTKAR